MKTNSISKIFIACFSSLILISCESHEQKTDDAFNQYKEDKLLAIDSIGTDSITASSNTPVVLKTEIQDEWSIFKSETDNKISANENKIKSIKSNTKSSPKLISKATRLQKENDDLKVQMTAFHEEQKASWTKFKKKMNEDVKAISVDLKDIAANDKK